MNLQQYFKNLAAQELVGVEEAIAFFQKHFPETDIESLELKFDGARFKYEMRGLNDDTRYEFAFNAATTTIFKIKPKPLKEKYRGGVRRREKAVALDHLQPLEALMDLAAAQVPAGYRPYEWELERKGEVTVWEIEYTDAQGDKEMEIKINAQTGDLIKIEFPR